MQTVPCDSTSHRLRVLRDLQILDTSMERAYDDIVALACSIFDAPISMVSLLDEHRQWFKAQIGMGCSETDLESSFCIHAVRRNETLVVENALLDPRFATSSLVTEDPGVRFYAGAPIYADGVPIGTVCVLDWRPRRPLREQLEMLEMLARQVGELIALRQTSQRLTRSEARFEAFMGHAPVAAYVKDEAGRYMYMSPFAETIFRASIETITGSEDAQWMDPHTVAAMRQHESEVRETGRTIRREFTVVTPDGVERDWSVAKFPFEDPTGGSLIGAVASDITTIKDAERLIARHLSASRQYAERLEESNYQLEVLASTDGLTGLLNRRAFNSEVIARMSAGGFALVMLDVDHFKRHNDSFGHAKGDEVLQQVGEMIQGSIRVDDLAGRIGGEEFALLIHDADLTAAQRFAERLRTTIGIGPWNERPVTASFGVTAWKAGDTLDRLFARTDRALYDAKQTGRDRVVVS